MTKEDKKKREEQIPPQHYNAPKYRMPNWKSKSRMRCMMKKLENGMKVLIKRAGFKYEFDIVKDLDKLGFREVNKCYG